MDQTEPGGSGDRGIGRSKAGDRAGEVLTPKKAMLRTTVAFSAEVRES